MIIRLSEKAKNIARRSFIGLAVGDFMAATAPDSKAASAFCLRGSLSSI